MLNEAKTNGHEPVTRAWEVRIEQHFAEIAATGEQRVLALSQVGYQLGIWGSTLRGHTHPQPKTTYTSTPWDSVVADYRQKGYTGSKFPIVTTTTGMCGPRRPAATL